MAAHMCPVCRAPRDIELRDHVPPLTHLRIALIVLFCAGVLYRLAGTQMAWRAAFFYLPIWAGAEFMHWVKMRNATKCVVCDFDPVLYQKNPMEARARVEQKLNGCVEDLKLKLKQKSPSAPKPPAEAKGEIKTVVAPVTPRPDKNA